MMRSWTRVVVMMTMLVGMVVALMGVGSTQAVEIKTISSVLQKDIPILIVDLDGVPVDGLTLSDVDLYYACSGQSTATQFNETGDTLREVNPAAGQTTYYWTSNDTLTNCAAPTVMTVSGGGSGILVLPSAIDIIEANSGRIVDGEITSVKAPNLNVAIDSRMAAADATWRTYNVVDQTNDGGNQNPTTIAFDTDLPQTVDITATTPKPILYFPMTAESSAQSGSCNLQGLRTQMTTHNTGTAVIGVNALPAAPDYRCVFRIY